MINLNDIKAVFKGEAKAVAKAEPAPQAQITALVTFDHGPEVTAEVAQALQEAGFSVDKVTKNEDGTLVYVQADDYLTDAKLVKVSDNMVAVVKGFDPYGMVDAGDFAANATTQGFYGSIRSATETLNYMLSTEMCSADTPQAAAAAVKSLVAKFGDYVAGMASALPQKAFKADKSLTEVVEKACKPKMGDKEPDADDEEKKAKAKKAEEDAAAAALAAQAVVEPAPADPAAATEVVTEPVAKTEPTEVQKMLEGLATLSNLVTESTKKMDALAQTVEAVQLAQKASEEKLDSVAKKADTASQALTTTVLAVGHEADTPSGAQQQVAKAESSDPRTGTFDTAFITKRDKKK